MSNAARSPKLDLEALAKKVCERIAQVTGNVFGDRQMPMVHARLRRHLAELKLTPHDYLAYWKLNSAAEDEALIGLLTTHFTSFFREFLHFEWLGEHLPALVAQAKQEGRDELRIWSAACSRGQEVWSLAMWLHHHMPSIAPEMKWKVYGSDIDAESVKQAVNGVYHHRELETVPRHLWQGHWQRGTGDIADWMKIKASLRSKCSFAVDNLLSPRLAPTEKFDVIFCRNVLIYFNSDDQKKAVLNLARYLRPAGVLVTGVSESLSNIGMDLHTFAPSVYSFAKQTAVAKPASMASALRVPNPLRVLCVDDSATVIKILKKLLTHADFEVVGTASNGEEAQAMALSCSPDIITLDLHMPVMDGFKLVRETDLARKFPIVVLSTVERDNAALVHPLFEQGVCDFLEKPSFENLSKIGEELHQKLKMAWLAKKRQLNMAESEKPKPGRTRPPGRILINGGLADRDAIKDLLKNGEFQRDQIFVYLNGDKLLWEDWALELKSEFMGLHLTIESTPSWTKDERPCVCLHLAGGSSEIAEFAHQKNAIVLLEDTQWPESVRRLGTDLFPVTSFAYMAHKYLEGK